VTDEHWAGIGGVGRTFLSDGVGGRGEAAGPPHNDVLGATGVRARPAVIMTASRVLPGARSSN